MLAMLAMVVFFINEMWGAGLMISGKNMCLQGVGLLIFGEKTCFQLRCIDATLPGRLEPCLGKPQPCLGSPIFDPGRLKPGPERPQLVPPKAQLGPFGPGLGLPGTGSSLPGPGTGLPGLSHDSHDIMNGLPTDQRTNGPTDTLLQRWIINYLLLHKRTLQH